MATGPRWGRCTRAWTSRSSIDARGRQPGPAAALGQAPGLAAVRAAAGVAVRASGHESTGRESGRGADPCHRPLDDPLAVADPGDLSAARSVRPAWPAAPPARVGCCGLHLRAAALPGLCLEVQQPVDEGRN